MKIKITDFSFVLKIALLSSLILIGKFSNKTGFQINNSKITNNSVSDTGKKKSPYQQLIVKEVALKVKN